MNRVSSAPGMPPINYLQFLLLSCLIRASKCICNPAWSQPRSASHSSLDHGIQVYPQTRSIMASKFTSPWPPKCITKLALSLPPSSHDNGLQSTSLHSLDHGLQVHLSVYSIVIFRHILNRSQEPPPPSPDIPCVDGSLYRSIDENATWINVF